MRGCGISHEQERVWHIVTGEGVAYIMTEEGVTYHDRRGCGIS